MNRNWVAVPSPMLRRGTRVLDGMDSPARPRAGVGLISKYWYWGRHLLVASGGRAGWSIGWSWSNQEGEIRPQRCSQLSWWKFVADLGSPASYGEWDKDPNLEITRLGEIVISLHPMRSWIMQQPWRYGHIRSKEYLRELKINTGRWI